MNTTINISLPKEMYEDAKKAVSNEKYSSISEFIRDALRNRLYKGSEYTINGFTPEFEQMALESEADPEVNDTILETEEAIHNYFLHHKKPGRNDKDKKLR